MRVPLSILNAIILLIRAQVVSGVPTTKTAVKDVLCVITGKALPMCSAAEDDAEATSEDAETSSLQGADQRECRHNLEEFGLRIGLDCPQQQERTDTILNLLHAWGNMIRRHSRLLFQSIDVNSTANPAVQ